MKIRRTIYSKRSDQELMIRLGNGEAGAFNELYSRYKDRLYYYFYRMLGNSKEKSEDFLQDLFCKIIDKPELYDPARSFSTWIFSIANNMCKNEYRRMANRSNSSLSENDEVYEAPVVEESDIHATISDLIYSSANTMSADHASCFILFYREGFSIEEISDALDILPGTVKSRLYYTRKKIREIFASDYPELIKQIRYEY